MDSEGVSRGGEKGLPEPCMAGNGCEGVQAGSRDEHSEDDSSC